MHSLKTVHVHWEKIYKQSHEIQSNDQRPVDIRWIKQNFNVVICAVNSPFSTVSFALILLQFFLQILLKPPHGNRNL